MTPKRPQKASQLATALIEHSSDAIALVDESGTVLYGNPAAARMLGLPIAEVINANVFRWVDDDDLIEFRANFSRTLEQPGLPVANAFRLRHADGTVRHVESVGVNRLADAGIRGIIINYRDVTESRRAEEAMRRDIAARLALEDQLRQAQKMDAIGRLAGGVAHDFNNVLTAIMGAVDLLSLMIRPEDPAWAEAESIRRAAERGADLSKRLLAFSRPPDAAATLIDLAATVGHMEPMLRRLVLDKIAIRVVPCSQPLPVRADDTSVSQVVLNLIVNARDAMPDGGVATIETGIIELSDPLAPTLGVPPGRYAGLSVADTGTGIPAEVHEHLFEPFFTTKPADQGTGLGLSIVYSIVRSLGGGIEVQSEAGQGARFVIYLPLAPNGQ